MYDAVKVWNAIAEQPRFTHWYPNEFVVRFLSMYVRRRTWNQQTVLHPTRNILGLDCGSGRHVVMLAKEGYTVSWLDVSPKAVELTHGRLQGERLEADVRVGSATALPWPDQHFDVIISHGCLDHLTKTDSEQAMAECARVLTPGGLLYCDLIATLESGSGHGPMVEGKTHLVPMGDDDWFVLQRFFDWADVRALLEPTFTILDAVLSQWGPVLWGDVSGLNTHGPLTPRESRYHIAARKA